MSFHRESSYSNAGLFRQTVEVMLYTPTATHQKKKTFADQEALTGARKVTKLLSKFESGILDLTPEEPPQPKPRTILPSPMTSTPVKGGAPDLKDFSEDDILEESFAKLELVETPILRQVHRRPKIAPMYRTPTKKALGSTCSSASSTSSGNSTVRSTYDAPTQIIRDEVHSKFIKYFKWGDEMLHTIAINVSEMRLQAIYQIPCGRYTETVHCMKTMYESCMRGAGNKEMNALCSALFDLLDDGVNMVKLSAHEEFVVAKYNKKI